jgi:hypothetical protein
MERISKYLPKIMNEGVRLVESEATPATTDKCGLADRYMVGIRTIEAWQSKGIIRGIRQRKRIFFDVEECDRRLRRFGNQIYGNNQQNPNGSALRR